MSVETNVVDGRDLWAVVDRDDEPLGPLFVDVAALLSGGLPEPPQPIVLTRLDGQPLLYPGQVNIVFGDPESGKSWLCYAAAAEALAAVRRVLIIDADHNGAAQILSRLVALGVSPTVLANAELFRLAEPEDGEHLLAVVAEGRAWRPAVAIADSIGEIVPMLGYSSNSPDEYTRAHRQVLTALARAGAVVLGLDHLPKNDDARRHGQTGTLAKRRAVGGVSLRVTLREPFAPGRGGAAALSIAKDRPGTVRAVCPVVGTEQPAGIFVLEPTPDGGLRWYITAPTMADLGEQVSDEDLAEIDSLDPPPISVEDVRRRLQWRKARAVLALRVWRQRVAEGES